MCIRSRDAISIRGDHKRCSALLDLLATNHDGLSRLVVDSELSSLECCITLGISFIKIVIDLGKLYSASDYRVITLDAFVICLHMEVICSILSYSHFEDLIIDKISFRGFYLLDQICSERISSLSILVLVQSIIGIT